MVAGILCSLCFKSVDIFRAFLVSSQVHLPYWYSSCAHFLDVMIDGAPVIVLVIQSYILIDPYNPWLTLVPVISVDG